ncbi:MAG: ComF family protein [Paludibacteraceae bacterium]
MMALGLFHYFIDLLYPNLCLICGENLVSGENQLCLKCFHNTPKTNYHLQQDNPVEKRFWGKVPIERATSYFFFQKGSDFQKLIHELKYRGNKEVGITMGKFAGADLLESDDFMSVDMIVPVPLHEKKEAKRGYNQSEMICKGLADVMKKPLCTGNLCRTQENTTQTRKSVYERYENTQGIFKLKNSAEFAGKHVLIVDDVLTTGSTIEACIQVLMQAKNVKVSVFTLALAM